MKQREGNILPQSDFPILIEPERISFISTVEEARRAVHEEIEIKYFYEGGSTLLIGTETVAAKAGDVVVISPYEFHATVDLGTRTGKYLLLIVGLDFFADVPDAPDLGSILLGERMRFRTLFQNDAQLCYILDRIAQEHKEKREGYRLAIRGLMCQLLSRLMRDGMQQNGNNLQEGAVRYYAVVEPALRYVRDRYAEPITVEELADLCNVSKYHFCRIFKLVTGKTAIQYLNEYRLKLAKLLLLNTDERVSQIALNCGFEDENYFCRYYKRLFGTSPGKERKA